MLIAFRHAETFSACGSMSGTVDLSSSGKNQALIKLIGDKDSTWENYSVMSIIEKYPEDSLAMIIDCGTEDFLYPGNKALHEKMLKLKIPHDYIERSGKHDWPYWRNAIEYHLLFFKRIFDKSL
jgi:S-formylglutathione hydrolase FrmB